MLHLLHLLPFILLASLGPIPVWLPLMQVKKRTLESSSLTLQHKHGVSGSQYINYREALRLVLVSHMPISWTNPCCQREEVLWLVRPVWRPTGSPSQITHSEREQSPSGSKTELIKRTQSHYGLFLRLSTVRQVTHGRVFVFILASWEARSFKEKIIIIILLSTYF